MWEDLKGTNKKMVVFTILGFIFAIVMLVIIFFNLFGFVDFFLEDERLTAGDIRLYGGILFVLFGFSMLVGLRRAFTESPMKSLEKFAKTTDNPEATMERLKETWENGYKLGRSRMDEEYFITFLNGPYAFIVPLKDVVWAYKSVTRLNFIVKTNTMLIIHYANQKSKQIGLRESTIDFILQQFMEKHRDIAVGHNKDTEKLYFKKDMTGLKEYARQQRTGLNL